NQIELLLHDLYARKFRLAFASRSIGMAGQRHVAGSRANEPSNDANQGALAGAITADQGVNLSGMCVELAMAQDRRFAIAFGQSLNIEQGLHCACHLERESSVIRSTGVSTSSTRASGS